MRTYIRQLVGWVHRHTWVRWLGSFAIFCILLVIVVHVAVTIALLPSIAGTIDELDPAEAVLVLGASVYGDGTLSPILQDRVDTAIEVYRAGKAKKILMSGDNSRLSYNEVVPVHSYLLAQGIPPEDVFLDYAGFDTYDTMYRAREVFEVKQVIIVTQKFHLTRAVFLALSVGMRVQGMPATDEPGTLRNYLREIPASIKAVADVVLRSSPTYLGEHVPITGDGRQTFGE